MVRFVGTKVRFARGSGGVSPSSSGINFSTILRSSAKDRTPNLCSVIVPIWKQASSHAHPVLVSL